AAGGVGPVVAPDAPVGEHRELAPGISQARELGAENGLDLSDGVAHGSLPGAHSSSIFGDSPPCLSALLPTRTSSGAGIDRPEISASPVESEGNSSMSAWLSCSVDLTMKRWSSGFLMRIVISVLHWLVTSASSLLGRWLMTAIPTPNLRPSAAICLMTPRLMELPPAGAKLCPSS